MNSIHVARQIHEFTSPGHDAPPNSWNRGRADVPALPRPIISSFRSGPLCRPSNSRKKARRPAAPNKDRLMKGAPGATVAAHKAGRESSGKTEPMLLAQPLRRSGMTRLAIPCVQHQPFNTFHVGCTGCAGAALAPIRQDQACPSPKIAPPSMGRHHMMDKRPAACGAKSNARNFRRTAIMPPMRFGIKKVLPGTVCRMPGKTVRAWEMPAGRLAIERRLAKQ